MRTWRAFLLLAAVCAMCANAADDFPVKPIRIVVAYAPGGGNDLFARVLGKRMSETLGKPIVVDNRPGANGIIGTKLVAAATPDGYTVILADMAHATNPLVYSSAQYDAVKDFAPVTMLGSAPIILIVHPAFAPQSLAEFIDLAKKQPGRITMGSGGTGSTSQFAGEFFQTKTGIKLNHVPYKGTGPALSDAVAGQIQCIFSPVAAAIPLVTSGRLRALAISSAKRAPIVADVPTFDELGVSDYRVGGWYGILAPAGTPRPVVMRLNQEFVAAVRAPEVRSRFDEALVTPQTGTPEQFAAFLRDENARWSQLIKVVGIKVD